MNRNRFSSLLASLRSLSHIVKFRFGLVPQVISLVVLAVLLVGGLISAVMVRQSQSTLREQIIANNLASAELAAEFARHYIEGTQISIRLFSRGPLVEESVVADRFSDLTAELQQVLQINKRLDGCSLFDTRGINRATGNSPASGLGNYSGDRDWFKQVMATGNPFLGIPVISRGTGRPAVPYAVPILDRQRQVKGILICGISLVTLNDAIAKFSTGPAARASMVDRRQGGIILAHPDRSRILAPVTGRNPAVNQLLAGHRGAMESLDSSGELNLAVYTPVPDLPWGFLILQPSEVAFAPITQAARQSMIYIALLLVLSAFVGGLLAQHITLPLVRLRAAAGRLAAGDIAMRLNFTRQDEVGDLGRAFDSMAAALLERSAQLRVAHEELQSQYLQVQDANRLKSEFLANMSHELRTPLNAIIGFTQLMHDGKVGAVSADQQEYLNDILTSADHLLQLINDVLDLAKVESGKLELRPEAVQLTRLITELRNILQPLAASKRLTIDISIADDVELIVIDPAKLKQVLYNYLSNAIKFTPDNGQIVVRAQAEDDEHFRLDVQDTGLGVMPEEIDKLFVAFQQLDSGAGKKHQGTGLGLALTKKIVEAQGGRVGVQSSRGRGSVFYAILPKNGRLNNELPVPSLAATALPGDTASILVIEDSEVDLKWLCQTLSESGYCVDAARTGADGIKKARDHRYAAILLDLILPDTGGWDILHSIRSAGPNQSTPVIVITVVAEKGVAKGFAIQDYLVKPIRPKVLLDSLNGAGVRPKGMKPRVLVVDDDVKILKLATAGLQAEGYEVVCHTDGAAALHDASRSGYAAVVLDLLMPQMNGYEFLDRFRRIDQCRNTLVIVWTSKDIGTAEMERLKNGAQAVALKDRRGIDTVLQELRRHACDTANPDLPQVMPAAVQ
jgi:signal transduction histidine kinase/DNA-binding response OmpR family regulator